MRVLVARASGYVGGRLVPALLERGHAVRCLARTPRKLDAAPWRDAVEVVAGDLDGTIDGELGEAFAAVDAAVYLVHSIGDGHDWAARESAHAARFRSAAEAAGVGRIIYLGGLGDDDTALSEHLRSRHEVGRVLAAGPTPTTELRAAMIIGSGSASFEMLRYLTEVLPVMVTPRWVRTLCQPISIVDVVAYLVAAIERATPVDGAVDIGGPDVVSYAELMAIYAREAGLARRRLIPVPVLTPRLSSLWISLVTPVPSKIARPLVDSLVNPVVVESPRAARDFPAVEPMGLADAIRRAIGNTAEGAIPTSFWDASYSIWAPAATDPSWSGGTVLTDERVANVDASLAPTWSTILRIGGERGWYSGELLWRARGVLDQIAGGPGLRRGRRHPDRLAIGEPLDFWRVEDLVPEQRLVLHAEMRLPGEAWLEWELTPIDAGTTRVVQRARFRPRGLLGRAYWYAVAPFHRFVFPGLLAGLGRDSHAQARGALSPSTTASAGARAAS